MKLPIKPIIPNLPGIPVPAIDLHKAAAEIVDESSRAVVQWLRRQSPRLKLPPRVPAAPGDRHVLRVVQLGPIDQRTRMVPVGVWYFSRQQLIRAELQHLVNSPHSGAGLGVLA